MNQNIIIEKVLSVSYPPITSYQHHANLLSILSYNPDNMAWFYNYYFQLVMRKDLNDRMDFNISYSIIPFLKNCPLITYNGLSRLLIKKKWSDIKEFLIDSINCGYYIYLVVDQYYIPEYEYNYNVRHIPHDLMIYGYDQNKQIFYVADFFKSRKYGYATATFSEIEQAYIAVDGMDGMDWMDGVIMLKENKSYQHNFSITILKNYISDYIKSENSNQRTLLINTWLNDKDFAFGLQVYTTLEKNLKNRIDKVKNVAIQPFHLLWDHKRINLLLLEYLYKKGYVNNVDYFYDIFKEIERSTLILRNLILKYNITKKKDIAYKAISLLRNISKKEEYVLKDFVKNINDYPLLYIPQNTQIKCTSLSIRHSDNWNVHENGKELFYHVNIKNAFVSLMFYGTSISYVAKKNKDCGYVKVYIDEKETAIIDLYSEEEKNNEVVYINKSLVLGYHTIKIECMAEYSAQSKECYVNLVRFDAFTDNFAKVQENFVNFVGINKHINGDWLNVYGKDGYDLIGLVPNYPIYADVKYKNAEYYIFPNTENDKRALQNPNDLSNRLVAIMCNPDSFEVQLCISGDEEKMVTFYLIDYDIHERENVIEAVDSVNKNVLSSYNVEKFGEGIYISFIIKGRIDFIFKNISKSKEKYQNAVLSAIFFDSL